MKRILSILLTFALIASLATTTALAQNTTLKVQDRTKTYSFHVGDTFTYTYWLHLTSDTIKKVIKADSLNLSTSKLKTDVDIQLKSFSGNIMYDDEMLELVDAKMPNFQHGRCIQKTDAISGSLLDGTVLDFTNGDLFFYVPSLLMSSAEQKTFQKTAIAVTCTFRVKAASAEPTYMRTKLWNMDVYAQYSTVNTEMSIVKYGTAKCVYASYETVNKEKPTSMLYPLVQDSGMDIRYLDLDQNELRPGAGVTVTFEGYSIDLKQVKKEAKTDGSNVIWFYDIPYGTYYVHCAFKDADGHYYATSDPEKGEVVNIPATGRVQALWLTKPGPSSLQAPSVTAVTHNPTGVTVKWNSVEGAEKYRVFYKAEGATSWTRVGDTTETSICVTGLKSGTKYTFVVRCIDLEGTTYTSPYNAGKTITYISAPALTSVSNVANGVTVRWNAPKGAVKYRVFYKANGAKSWTKCGDTSQTSLTVTGLTSGTAYTFTVQCINSSGSSYTSSFDPNGISITYVAAPIISSAKNSPTGVTVKWNAVKGAEKYRVYYKTNSAKNWTKADDTTDTSLNVTGLTSGTTYRFVVRCVNAEGTAYTSAYDTTGKTVTYISAPTITKLTNTTSGVTVQWNASAGAAKYRVFYKVADGKWTKCGDTSSTSKTITGLQSGTAYTFTVQCISSDGKTYTSSYDPIGMSIMYLSAPEITAAKNSSTGVLVTWQAVDGAENYRVYYKTDGAKSWTKVGDTADTSLNVTGLSSGTTYRFVVRCVNAEGTAYTSAYNSTGKTVTYIAAPVISSATNTPTGIQVTWQPSPGADNYRVFYKVDGGKFTRCGDTSDTTKVITGLQSGTAYTFTVQCISSDGKTYISSYDPIGLCVVRSDVTNP